MAHHDIEKIIAAVREYAVEHDYVGTTLTFRRVERVPAGLDLALAGVDVFVIDAVNRRNGRANGFARLYAAKINEAGTITITEYVDALKRHRAIGM